MYKNAIAVAVVLIGSGVSPAWAGCWGGGYRGGWSGAGYGCWGGGYSSGWTAVGAGCWGGGWTPVQSGYYGGCLGGASYGCCGYSTGWSPVGYGCCGGASASAWTPVGSSSYAVAAGYKPYHEEVVREETVSVKQSARRPVAKPPVVRYSKPVKAAAAATDATRAEEIGSPEEDGKATATIVVSLPAAAKLKVNNVAIRQSSEKRTLVSPPLARGKDFHYRLEAQFVQKGRTFTAARRVAVRAGEVKQVTLEFAAPEEPAPTAGAERIAPEERSRLPEEAAQPAASRPSS